MPPRVDEATDKLVCRQATAEEANAIYQTPDTYETWVGVLDRGGQIVGTICLTKRDSDWFWHNTWNGSGDPAGFIRLYKLAKKKLKSAGATAAFIHMEPGYPKKMHDFWVSRGAKLVFAMFKIDVQ